LMIFIVALSTKFDIHPLNWQNVNQLPPNMTEASDSNKNTIAFAIFNRSSTLGGNNDSGIINVTTARGG
jgi:hypothetical protein